MIAECELVRKCREDEKVIGGFCFIPREKETSDPDIVIKFSLNNGTGNGCFPYSCHATEPEYTSVIIAFDPFDDLHKHTCTRVREAR